MALAPTGAHPEPGFVAEPLSRDEFKQADAAAGKPGAGWLAGHPWIAVALLMLIGILNYLDRALPAILVEPIKRDLGLSDTAIGLINGIGFLLVYACASIPLAKISDRGNYKLVIVVSLGVWSAMTALGGWVAAGWQFFVSRMGVALGEAGGIPAAHAYIVRHIPASSRTIALTVFGLCIPLGSMLGFVVGGVVGQQLGWRATLVSMGVLGVALAVLTLFCLGRGDARAAEQAAGAEQRPASLALLFKKRSLFAILTGSSFMGFAGYTAITFSSAFLMRSHGMSLKEAGLTYGIAGGIGAIAGLLVLGTFANHLSKKDPRWLLGTLVLAILACLPFSVLAFVLDNRNMAILGLALNQTLGAAYAIPIYAALHRLAPLQLRARASALQIVAPSILGALGPVATGRISDLLAPSLESAALGRAMLLIVPTGYGIAALAFALALLTFGREIEPE